MAYAYDALTVREKADFIAGLLNDGLEEYFDTCQRQDNGDYIYHSAQAERDYTYTPEGLVTAFERFGLDELRGYYEDRKEPRQ